MQTAPPPVQASRYWGPPPQSDDSHSGSYLWWLPVPASTQLLRQSAFSFPIEEDPRLPSGRKDPQLNHAKAPHLFAFPVLEITPSPFSLPVCSDPAVRKSSVSCPQVGVRDRPTLQVPLASFEAAFGKSPSGFRRGDTDLWAPWLGEGTQGQRIPQ